VLLVGERVEDVFMLGEGLPGRDQRRVLAEAVMADSADPRAWWALLQHVLEVFGDDKRYG
jgi:hypothetical protein